MSGTLEPLGERLKAKTGNAHDTGFVDASVTCAPRFASLPWPSSARLRMGSRATAPRLPWSRPSISSSWRPRPRRWAGVRPSRPYRSASSGARSRCPPARAPQDATVVISSLASNHFIVGWVCPSGRPKGSSRMYRQSADMRITADEGDGASANPMISSGTSPPSPRGYYPPLGGGAAWSVATVRVNPSFGKPV